MLVRFLVLELLFQALSRYSKILVYTCISTIFCSRTVILQLLVVQVVWFLLQFLCLRCIARSAYVINKKVSIINCFKNSTSFKAIYSFFEIHKLKIFEKKNSVFVSVSLRSLLFSNCQLAMFFQIRKLRFSQQIQCF